MSHSGVIEPIASHLVTGTPSQRGKQMGEFSRAKIEHSLDVYERLFLLCDINWKAAVEKGSRYLDQTNRFAPSVVEELHGMASGAGVEFDSLFTLNCRTEILPADFLKRALATVDQGKLLSGNGCKPGDMATNECTSLASASKPGDVWLAQNWDWCGLQRKALCVVHGDCTDNHSQITVTEAGMLAKIGINSHGFGITLNILRSGDDGKKSGVPVHVLLRALLDCKNVEEAVELVEPLVFGSSSNILVADASGNIASFELSPAGCRVLKPDSTSLCHTNHFLHPDFTKNDIGCVGNTSTFNRLDTALNSVQGSMNYTSIKQLLCDTSDGLESICRFPDNRFPEIAQIETVTSVIMNLSAGSLAVSAAQPSISEFKEYFVS